MKPALILFLLILIFFQVPAQQSGDKVRSIYIDEYGNQWFGTDSGLLRKQKDVWKGYYLKTGLPCVVNDIKKKNRNDQDLWIATSAGLYKVSYTAEAISGITEFNSSKTNFRSDEINAITFDEKDAGYFATPKGIGVFVNEVWKFYTRLQDIFRNEFTSVRAKADTVYFGTKGEGIARIVRNIDGYTGASSYISPWSPLPGDSITSVFIDSGGNQWYGTTRGLTRHSNTEAKEGWNFSLTDEIPCRYVTSIAEDRLGNFWIGTHCGLFKLSADLRKLDIWTVKDGLPSDRINCIYPDKDQSVWIGTSRGASHFAGSGFTNFRTSEFTRDLIPSQ